MKFSSRFRDCDTGRAAETCARSPSSCSFKKKSSDDEDQLTTQDDANDQVIADKTDCFRGVTALTGRDLITRTAR